MTLEDVGAVIKDQFPDIVNKILKPSPDKLRLVLNDKSFVDIRISQNVKNRFDFHWERRHIDGAIYRYDNFPDTKFKKVTTFPYYFHKGQEGTVVASPFGKTLPRAFTDFMTFIREHLS